MALRKIIFDNATVGARDLGAAFAGICADGRISGGAVSYSGGVVNIGAGYLMACGRLIENSSAIQITPSGTSGVAQIVLTLDVSGSGTVNVVTRTAESEGALTPLTQDDINDGSSTTYEMELALVDLAQRTLIRAMGMAGHPIRIVDAAPETGAADGLYFVRKAAE